MSRKTLRNLLLSVVLTGALVSSQSALGIPDLKGGSGAKENGQATVQGNLSVVHSDDLDRGSTRLEYLLETRDERLRLVFGSEPADLETGMTVKATGERHGDQMRVHRYEMAAAPPEGKGGGKGGGGKGGGGKSDKGGSNKDALFGPQQALVILFNFSNDLSRPADPSILKDRVFGDLTPSADTYFDEISFGNIDIVGLREATGDVAGWFTIADDNSGCSFGALAGWGDQAKALASSAGYDPEAYDNVIHFFPHTDSCTFSGAAFVGGSDSYLNGSTSSGVISHELGHNYSLHHANRLECADDSGARISIGRASHCDSVEYGDPFDVMGTTRHGTSLPDPACSNFCHLNAFNKARLGWIGSTNIQDAASSGDYTLVPIENSAEGKQILRIKRDPFTFLYVEYRRPFGYDDFDATAPVANGATIRMGGKLSRGGVTSLVDTTPGTPSFHDAPLQAGQIFFDPVGGTRIETILATLTELTVRVTFD